MPSRLVEKFMTTELITCQRGDKLRDVSALFAAKPIGAVPVVKKDNILCGIITKIDLLGFFLPEYLELFSNIDFIQDFSTLQSCNLDVLDSNLLLATDVMSYEPPTITLDTPLLKCAALMQKKGVELLCVVDEEKHLLGVISSTDIARAFFGKYQLEAGHGNAADQ